MTGQDPESLSVFVNTRSLSHTNRKRACVCVCACVCEKRIRTLKHCCQTISKTVWAAESQEVGSLSFTFRELVWLCTGKSTTVMCCRMRFNYAPQNWFPPKFSGMQEHCSWLVLIAFLWNLCFSESKGQVLNISVHAIAKDMQYGILYTHK